MRVNERMTPHPVVATVDMPVTEAMQLIEENHFRRLPVLDGKGDLVGIITDRELQKALPSDATSLSAHELNYILMKTTVGDIMPKKKVITIEADELLEEAAILMRDHKIGAIPVTREGKLAGIITETNIFDAFIDIMGLREPGYRITVRIEGNPPGILGRIATVLGNHNGNISHVATHVDAVEQSVIVFRINRIDDIEAVIQEIKTMGVYASYIAV
ncbi:MAG TPA: histidine kinase [Peptococcaceae bacterium]|nr:histidine kinase [Peptococcaceae bacterium]